MSHYFRIAFVKRDDEFHSARTIFGHAYSLAEEACCAVPGDDRIATRRHVVQDKPAGGVCLGGPSIGTDQDGAGHIRVKVAVHKHYARLIEINRACMILRIIAEIESLGLRQ